MRHPDDRPLPPPPRHQDWPDLHCASATASKTPGPICAAIPGHTLDEHVGQLLIATLTPLAVEAALPVTAELEQRADQADALRAAHVERAHYHADLARRRYLAVDPANRLVADTLEADWNTALRALNDAQAAYDKAREQHTGQLTDAQKTRIAQLVTDLPAIWNDPATPMRERKRIARLLLTDVTVTRTGDTITAHVRLRGGQTAPSPCRCPNRPWRPAGPRPRSSPPSTSSSTSTPADRSPASSTSAACASGTGEPFHRLIIDHIIRAYRSAAAASGSAAGLLTLAETAAAHGVHQQHHQSLATRRNCQCPAV